LETEFKRHRGKYKIIIMAIFLASACFFIYYIHGVLKTGIIFTHFFYIPAILASFWWKRKGLFVALFLGIAVIFSHLLFKCDEHILEDSVRMTMLFITSSVVALLSERIEERGKVIKESEEKFRAIFDNAIDGIILTDVKNRKFYTGNKAICQMLGYSEEEIKNLGVTDIHPQEDLPYIIEQFEKQSRKEIALAKDIPVKRKDGSIFYADINSSLITVAGETYLLSIFRDITERKQVEEALRESENYLKNLLDAINTGILVITPETHQIIDINSSALAMIGVSKEQVLGQICHKYICPAEVGKCPVTDLKQTVDLSERILLKSNGEQIKILKSVVPLEYKNRSYLIESFVDLTERKRAEEALREMNAQLQSLIQAIPDAVFFKDVQGRHLLANKAVEEFFGMKQEEIVGKTNEELGMPPELAEYCQKSDAEIMRTQKPLRTEEQSSKGTEKIFLDTIKVPIFDDKGKAIGLVGVSRDITELKLAEETLRKSEERYRTLFEESKDVVYISTPEGKFVDINPAGVELFGYSSKEELFKIDITQALYFNPEERQKFQQAIEKQGYVKDFELVLKRKDGRKVIVLVTATTVRDEKGNISGYRGIIRDVTKHKYAEEEIQRTKTHLESILNNSLDLIFTIKKDGTFGYINPQLEKITGYRQEEVVGKNFMEFIPEHRKNFMLEKWREINAGISGTYETEIIKHDGTLMYCLISHSVMEGFNEFLVVLRDITERKRGEEKLQQSFDNLQKTLEGTILAMAKIVETKDPYTAGHQQQVAKLSCAIAKEMGLSEERFNALQMAALIHDVGKIYVPTEILSKPGRLNEIESRLIKTHPQVGYDILKTIEFLWPVVEIILQHHERMDGSGYPQGLSGRNILLEARILGVADVVEAMSSHRPYRKAIGIGKALEEISKNKGILYDPQVVDICFKLFYEKGFKFD